MAFDGNGDLYATSFQANQMTKFDRLNGVTITPWGGPFSLHPESAVYDNSAEFTLARWLSANRDSLQRRGSILELELAVWHHTAPAGSGCAYSTTLRFPLPSRSP